MFLLFFKLRLLCHSAPLEKDGQNSDSWCLLELWTDFRLHLAVIKLFPKGTCHWTVKILLNIQETKVAYKKSCYKGLEVVWALRSTTLMSTAFGSKLTQVWLSKTWWRKSSHSYLILPTHKTLGEVLGIICLLSSRLVSVHLEVSLFTNCIVQMSPSWKAGTLNCLDHYLFTKQFAVTCPHSHVR